MKTYPNTPGPWAIGSNGASTKVVDSDGKAICMVTPRHEAWNGDLLAAAPELLAALQTIVAGYQAHFDAMPVAWQTYDNIARAAIAKAEG